MRVKLKKLITIFRDEETNRSILKNVSKEPSIVSEGFIVSVLINVFHFFIDCFEESVQNEVQENVLELFNKEVKDRYDLIDDITIDEEGNIIDD